MRPGDTPAKWSSTSVAVTMHDFKSTDIPAAHREALTAHLENSTTRSDPIQ